MRGTYTAILTFLLYQRVTLQQVSKKTTVVYRDENITIDCPIERDFVLPEWSGPPGNIPYYDPGTGIFSDKLGEKASRLSIAGNQRSLLLRNTKLTDEGTYICATASNNVIYQGENTIQVRIKANIPTITSSVSMSGNRLLATEDESLTVNCTSRGGNPAPTVVLYYGSINGSVLPGLKTTSMEGDTYTVTHSYTFTAKRQHDMHQLVCHTYWPIPTDAQDSQVTSVTLHLYLKPEHPTVTQTSMVVTGDAITVECRTKGSRPAASITWEYRNQKYTPNVTVTEDTPAKTFTVVSILRRPVTAEDNRQRAQCLVTNRAVSTALYAFTLLDVQFPLERLSTNITGNKVIVANGSNPLTLLCTTGSSNPPSNITWKNGNDVIINKKSYTNTTGTHNGVVRSQELTLYPTRNEDGNIISCLASNGILQVKDVASVKLDLNYPPLIAEIPDMNVTEGENVTMKCNASSKPLATFTWNNGSAVVAYGAGTSSYNGLDYTIDRVYRNQRGLYTCIANNNVFSYDSKETTLTVLYPPDIDVIAENSSVLRHSTTVTCEASGVPDHYTYEGWIHTWNGKVVSPPGSLPNTKVLTLTNLSYAHSGVYTCLASNGIKNGSRGSSTLLVKSYPIIIGSAGEQKKLKASGQLMHLINATIQFYSNAENTYVSVYKTNGTRHEVGDIYLSDKNVILPVFQTYINTTVTEALISINVTEEIQFGAYVISVKNEIGVVNLSLEVQPQGPPEPPFNISITVLNHQSVDVTWKSGFPNGLNQTFIIQLSTDNSSWRNISQYGGLSFLAVHTKRVHSLDGNRLYYVRMVATNELGESEPTSVKRFKTSASPVSSTSPQVGTIAGATGGAAAALVSVTVVIFIIWKRKGVSSSDKPKDKGVLVGTSNENLGFEDRDEVVNTLYESAGPRQSETILTSSAHEPTSKPPLGADVYAKVNKRSEEMYAMPNKPKGKKTEKNRKQISEKIDRGKGDVYENAQNNKYANGSKAPPGENVYEDTNIDVCQAPKKYPRADGLVYADLEFKSPPKGKGQKKIIGIEDKCEYTTIDLTKKAKPLPDIENEDMRK